MLLARGLGSVRFGLGLLDFAIDQGSLPRFGPWSDFAWLCGNDTGAGTGTGLGTGAGIDVGIGTGTGSRHWH